MNKLKYYEENRKLKLWRYGRYFETVKNVNNPL